MSFFKKFTDTVSKGVNSATEKAQQTVEVTRINAQISGKRKDIDKLFARIGESVYEAFQQKDLSLAESKVIPGCEEIDAIYEEIEILNSRVKEIRNEKECECGKRVPYDTRFCPSCGHPFPEPEPPIQEEDPGIAAELVEPEEALIGQEPVISSTESQVYKHAEANTDSIEETEVFAPAPVIVDQRQTCKSCETPLYGDSHFCPTCGQATR